MNKDKASKVLVVDDEPHNIELLSAYLEKGGYDALTAANGVEALELVDGDPPDLILLDAMMPKMNGFEVCKRLKENGKTRLIPIVMITALRDMEDKIKALELGADEFLSKPFNKAELMARVGALLKMKRLNDSLEAAEDVIFTLARTIEARDRYTEGHCERVSKFSVSLAKEAGLSETDQNALKNGGVLHDIGKIAIDEAILNKPGKLTPEEFEKMKSHPVKGADICRNLKTLASAIPVIRSHHEKMDGSGYPDGLKGEEIPVIARIMAIVDIYDALVTDRPYRKGLPLDTAENILRTESQKGWWDPELVDVFFKMLKDNKVSK
ncbi:MAG: response regulator [Nitrospirae bacterium]|nr:response regulator [Nitrospirota bacterium]